LAVEPVNLELSAPFDPLGTDTSEAYPYQEAAFLGNLFAENAEAYYCVGKDYAVVESRRGRWRPQVVVPDQHASQRPVKLNMARY
jgi:hypothetical protein